MSFQLEIGNVPPVRNALSNKQQKQRIVGLIFWRGLNSYGLKEVMRQTNQQLLLISSKIGDFE